MKNLLIKLYYMLIISSLLSFPQRLEAQNKEEDTSRHLGITKEIIATTLKENRGYKMLSELCEIGPRLSGSDNSLTAIKWAEKKLTEIGCDSVWLQPVMVPVWERGDVESAEIKFSDSNSKNLSIASLGGSIGTPPDGITAKVLEVQNFKQLEMLKEEAAGKIIFFNRPFDNSLVNTFTAYGNAVDQRVYGAAEAAKVGGVAAIVRSVTSKYDNTPHVGVMFYSDTVKQVPTAAIGLIDADFLSAKLKENPDLELTLKMDCKNLPEAQSFNVIGEISGSEFPDEILLVGGHFDSWDKGDGAHDDGAPCIQTMEVLDIFKRLNIKPKRTIRCVLFINEENGSRGAKAYAKETDSLKLNHLAAIEADRGIGTPRGFYVETDSLRLKKLQAWLPLLNYANIEWIKSGGSGADISHIKNSKALFGFVPVFQRYFDYHHSANDLFEEVHPREMELGTAAMAILVYLLSEEGL